MRWILPHPEGYPARLLDAYRRQQFSLVVCRPLMDELAQALQRPRLVRRFRVNLGATYNNPTCYLSEIPRLRFGMTSSLLRAKRCPSERSVVIPSEARNLACPKSVGSKLGYNMGVARLVSISEAAQLIGTQVSIIRDWIQKGLIQTVPLLPLGQMHRYFLLSEKPARFYGYSEELVDVDQLYEVAEEQGWLMLTAEAWDDDEAKS